MYHAACSTWRAGCADTVRCGVLLGLIGVARLAGCYGVYPVCSSVFREFYLPPFRGSVEAGVTGFMCSYSAITLTDNPTKMNNTPSCANAYMLTDVIRSEWNCKIMT